MSNMNAERNGHLRPLVSLVMACYNQEWCIREALEGAFSQTYSPLEIVILDDCSQDSTWDIIDSMVSEYRKTDGRHAVTAIRNPVNSYTSAPDVMNRLRSRFHALWHGELIVQADGDDVSLPNRVEELVSAWLATGKKADVLFSGQLLMNVRGQLLGRRSCRAQVRGASMAYTKRMEDFFGAFTTSEIMGDVVRWERGWMLGGSIRVDKDLVKYRICGGFSQVGRSFRIPMIRNYRRQVNAMEQILLDLEKIRYLHPDRYEKMRAFVRGEISRIESELALWESDVFWVRLKSFMRIGMKRRFFTGMIIYGPLLVLPRRIGDPVLDFVHLAMMKIRPK